MSEPSVFISYSHKDEEWKDRLVGHLGVLERQHLLRTWHDRRVGAGEDWSGKIREAINAARIAILLISTDYLTSEFILNEEVTHLLRRQAEGGLIIIPVLVRSCPWEHVDWLRRMQVRPVGGRALAKLEGDEQDHALADIAAEVAELLKHTEPPAPPVPPEPRPDEGDGPVEEDGRKPFRRLADKLVDRLRLHPVDDAEERRKLLKAVRRTWVDDVLADMSGPVGVPFSIRVRVRDVPGSAAPTDGRADIDVYPHFIKSNYRMVMLGEAGTGKTYKLLQLLKTLLENVPDDPEGRIPVYFNLSSWVAWAGRKESMHEWLVARLMADYYLSESMARKWAASGQLVLLLDGLDEITTRRALSDTSGTKEDKEQSRACRSECLKELNRYVNVMTAEVVLCCRTDAYDALGVTLDTQRDDATVEVMPLTEGDVRDSLRNAGADFASLREAVEVDAQLRKLAQTPFMLKAMATAYRQTSELTASAIMASGRGNEEARKTEVLDKYVKARLSAPTEPAPPKRYEFNKVKYYLSMLAEKMEQGDSRVFIVDELQPGGVWLDDAGRRLYRALVSLFLFAFIWLLVAVPTGWAVGFEKSDKALPIFERLLHFDTKAMLVSALCCGGLAAAGFALTKGWGFGIVCGLVFGAGRAIARRMGEDGWDWLAQGLVSAALGAAVLVPALYLRRHERDRIRLLQRSKLHRRQALIGVLAAAGVGVLFALILSQMRDPWYGIARGLSFGSALIPILGLSYGYLSASYEVRTSTDQGLRHTANLALSSAAACSMLGAVCFGTIYWGVLQNAQEGITNAIHGLSLGVISLLFGALPVLQHQGLRTILHRKRVVPRDLVDFLGVAGKLKLLRPVGGGHMFEHEFLRKYFLNLRQHIR